MAGTQVLEGSPDGAGGPRASGCEAARPRSERYPWSVFPSGWYAVAYSHELPRGGVLARHYFGRELAVFRTASGQAGVLDALCPHMGAHLGHGSRVDGEALRCSMHGFRYDVAGTCVSTPYAPKVPPAARAGAFPVRERNGAVLVWYDAADRPPVISQRRPMGRRNFPKAADGPPKFQRLRPPRACYIFGRWLPTVSATIMAISPAPSVERARRRSRS